MTSSKGNAKPGISATTMERVADIPELLDVIFGHNSTADNARCARASRAWSDVALNHVWRENPPLEALLSLLAPLVPAEIPNTWFRIKPTVVFARPIVCADERRFRSYAKRVISFKMTCDEMQRLDADVYFRLVLMCPGAVSILPRLKVLHVQGHYMLAGQGEFITRFFHGSLSEVNIQLARPDGERELLQAYRYQFAKDARRFILDDFLIRSPNIKRLVLWLDVSGVAIEDELCLLIDGLRHLEMLHLYTDGFLTPVLHSAAMLPNLCDFLMMATPCTDTECVEIKALDSDHAFRSLEELVLRKDLNALTQLFSSKTFPSGLRTLTIDMVGEIPFSDFQQCLKVLAISFPKLCMLEFPLREGSSWSSDPEPMTAHHLSPLTAFSFLECFELHIDEPFSISDEELVNIMKECLSLRALRIRCAYLSDPATSLTLGFLALLAKEPVGKSLKRLEIHLDATKINDLPVVEGHLEKLRTISFGISPVHASSEEVLLYLSQLIPATCQLKMYSRYDKNDKRRTRRNEEEDVQRRRRTWDEIGRSFETFDD